jgi:two-component system, NarL family, response regulator DevR
MAVIESSGVAQVAEVFLLAENRLLREALIRLLDKKGDIRIVGANSYSPSVADEIASASPGIILLDSGGLSSDVSLIPSLRSRLPDLRVVMVDMNSNESTFLRAVREGVVGYVLKDASAMEVAATIRAVAAGEAVCPPSLSLVLFRAAAQQAAAPSGFSWVADHGLSKREQQMVELLSERLTNKEIASRLNLSEQTVKNHVHHILRKLGAPNRTTIIQRCLTEHASAG